MTDQNQTQDGQKTIVAFIVGLLVGGLIVYMFVGSPAQEPQMNGDTDEITENGEVGTDENDENGNANTSNGSPSGDTQTLTSTPSMEVGEGSVTVNDQPAGSRVALEAVTFPMSDGWIGVRQLSNDQLGRILGVMRFSQSQGLIPEQIVLQQPTQPGVEYAIVFFTSDGSRQFNLATNVQVEGIFATFTAQ